MMNTLPNKGHIPWVRRTTKANRLNLRGVEEQLYDANLLYMKQVVTLKAALNPSQPCIMPLSPP
jgi:hypothetical protein